MSNDINLYSDAFFGRRIDSLNSAKVIVPIVLGYVSMRSVLDVGCGTGAFLSVFQDHGVDDILGVDGDWVRENKLCIPKQFFLPADLTQNLDLKRSFDLVVSLEVAEHLDKRYAALFVNNLIRHAKVILFSAAIPFQGGTHHTNEQWPDYWEKIFNEHGFVGIDCIRSRVWGEEKVSFWYAQNMIFYVEKSNLSRFKKLDDEYKSGSGRILSLVHPRLYEAKAIHAGRYEKIIHLFPMWMRTWIIRVVKSFRTN